MIRYIEYWQIFIKFVYKLTYVYDILAGHYMTCRQVDTIKIFYVYEWCRDTTLKRSIRECPEGKPLSETLKQWRPEHPRPAPYSGGV